jgi:hypothetical protein
VEPCTFIGTKIHVYRTLNKFGGTMNNVGGTMGNAYGALNKVIGIVNIW